MEDLVIQSNVCNLEKVEDYIWKVCESRNISDYYGIISVPVIQAVKNSIEHGNQYDEKKDVHIVCNQTSNGLNVSVTDEGCGFEFSRYGSFPENNNDKHGIFLMRLLADNISFIDGGRGVIMEFMLSGVDEALSASRRHALENYSTKCYVSV